MKTETMLTTAQAAKLIGVTRSWVKKLIRTGRLPAQWSEEGRRWKVGRADAVAYRDSSRAVGRPRK